MIALDIHVEGLNVKDFENGVKSKNMEYLLQKSIPHALSFCPGQSKIWNDQNPELFELFKESVRRAYNVLGQQGMTHKCKHEHKWADPWHENYCLWKRQLSRQEQKDFMERGREQLEKIFGVIPDLYAPPNHYFDETTLEIAAEMGYLFFSDKAMIPLAPYRNTSFTIIPERDLEKGKFDCKAVYIHYDEIDEVKDLFLYATDQAVSLRDLKAHHVPLWKIKLNEKLKYTYKIARDIKRTIRK